MENCKRISCILLIITVLTAFFEANAAVSANVVSLAEKTSVAAVNASDGVDIDIRSKKKSKKPHTKGAKSKKVTFETYEENYEKAVDYYNRHLYISAARLFEELYPLSLGTPRADTILFYFADSYFLNKDYEMAAFHFKEYTNKYSSNPRAELAHFKAIEALSHLSPEYSLDQTETNYVIEEVEVFTQRYPNSEYMEECNKLLDEMREKLARKSYEILKLYYNTENYKAAQIIGKNFLKEYSYSSYADDAYLILVRNNYDYAQKSVESRKYERYTACIEAFQAMRINCPASPFLVEAERYANDARAKIDKNDTKTSKKNNKVTKNKTEKNED